MKRPWQRGKICPNQGVADCRSEISLDEVLGVVAVLMTVVIITLTMLVVIALVVVVIATVAVDPGMSSKT